MQLLGLNLQHINSLKQIPFLPAELFKHHRIKCGSDPTEKVFTSSRTTNSIPSKHYISDLQLYKRNCIRIFNYFYGDLADHVMLALLPSYMERTGSSLIYMVEEMIKLSDNPESGFFLDNFEELDKTIQNLLAKNKKFILFGVSFALMEFSENYPSNLGSNIVMETGGMKGRRKEITREEMHEFLCARLSVKNIHSEYGMTELLSQAYSKGGGAFRCPPWMRVFIRDQRDPLSILETGENGCLNIIDLANVDSCAFIASGDLGKKISDNEFGVSGRTDNSDIRGCNLLLG